MSELTTSEKATLLGLNDSIRLDECDEELYTAMCSTELLDVDEVDDKVRRAIVKYTVEQLGDTFEDKGGLIMLGFVHGYCVGRRHKKSIRKKKE